MQLSISPAIQAGRGRPSGSSEVTEEVRRLLPFLLLGPLTGPLMAGLIFAVRAGRFGMAAVYGVGVLEVVLGLPALFWRELHFVAAHLR